MLRLERSLPGLNSRLRTARRAILAWDKTSPAARRSAVQNIIQVMESMNRRAEVLPYLRILKGGPRGKFGKTSTLKKAAALAGLGLAGFALGYASYDKRGGFGKRTGRGLRDSVELDTGNMLAEDRPTQLSYIVQKLPEHPAVEEIISVNYIADGISAFVRTTDGNAYEFEIRPARYAKGHEEKRMSSEELEEAWEYKVVEVEESDENT